MNKITEKDLRIVKLGNYEVDHIQNDGKSLKAITSNTTITFEDFDINNLEDHDYIYYIELDAYFDVDKTHTINVFNNYNMLLNQLWLHKCDVMSFGDFGKDNTTYEERINTILNYINEQMRGYI